MNSEQKYDVAIIGGGLAGLSLAILLKRKNYSVVVFEKDNYPRHKVCGEYISMESRPFLEDLGLSITQLNLPVIDQLQVTDVKGYMVTAPLPIGGFGISRYKLDAALADIAIKEGVILLTNHKVDEVAFTNNHFKITVNNNDFLATVACGTWGKRSNMDIKLQRSFIHEKKKPLNNYIGVKYHIKYNWPDNVIALHNFTNGYCGISKVEDDTCCLCYLTTAANLKRCSNDIKSMEEKVLMKNPYLKDIFCNASFLYPAPVTISQISFQKKEQIFEHALLLGDAAGLITPLCGNGMSMAFRGSKLAAEFIQPFLDRQISRQEMENGFAKSWKQIFSMRLTTGRLLQANFGKDKLTSIFLKTVKHMPFLQKKLIAATSGDVF